MIARAIHAFWLLALVLGFFRRAPGPALGDVLVSTSAGLEAAIAEANAGGDPTILLADYPGITFVHMTGHVDIWNDADNKAANRMIRDFCRAHSKVLLDFADFDAHDPDGTGYEFVHDDCNYYDAPLPGGTLLGNWATAWQLSHTEGADWYYCGSAHSEPLNANLKAYGSWWLWARLAGWPGPGASHPAVQTLLLDTP